MKKTDLVAALNLKADVAVSIYAPTHKMAPENQGDRIVVKNLVTQALDAITNLGPGRDYVKLVENVNSAFDSIDWNHSTDGVALLASEQGFHKFDLSHQPLEQVTVSDTFSIAELAKTVNKSWEYYLLVLSESPTRLFRGDREELAEIKGGFPFEHTGRGGSAGLPTAFGQQTSVIVDEEHRKFFRKISDELTKNQAIESLPLVVTGVERFLAFWSEVAPEHTPVVGIEGSYDFMSEAELTNKTWPQVQEYFRAQNKLVIEKLNIAKGNKTYAGGFEEVSEMAAAGRIGHLVISDDETANPVTELAVRATLSQGGEVSFVPAEYLEGYSSIAADMRF
jgi:hypothetical protein